MTKIVDFSSKQELSNKEIGIVENSKLKTLKLLQEFVNFSIERDAETTNPVDSSLTILIRANGETIYH